MKTVILIADSQTCSSTKACCILNQGDGYASCTKRNIQDYYKEQGFSFIMLVTGQIYQKMIQAVKLLNDNTMSIYDVLLMARVMKMERRGDNWLQKNTRRRDLEILKKLGFEPQQCITDST